MRNIQYLQYMCVIHTFERTVCVLDQYTRVQLCVDPRASMFSKYFRQIHFANGTCPIAAICRLVAARQMGPSSRRKASLPVFDCLIFRRWPIIAELIRILVVSLLYRGRLWVHGQFIVRDYWWYWMALNSLPIINLKFISLAR